MQSLSRGEGGRSCQNGMWSISLHALMLHSFSNEQMTTASEGSGALSYNGWKIFTWRFYHSAPDLQPMQISIQELLDSIKELFEQAEWVFQVESLGAGLASLVHIPTKYDVRVEVHGEELPIEYADTGLKEEAYLVTMRSEVLAWKQEEKAHKLFMTEVWNRVPWDWEKVACYLIDGIHQVVRSSNIEEKSFEPFEVLPQRWKTCPIPPLPEKKKKQRTIMRLRPVPRRSRLGVWIKPPKRQQTSESDN